MTLDGSGMNILIAGVPIVIIVVMILRENNKFSNTVYIQSSVDGKKYLVRDSAVKQQSADTLARLNQRALKLIAALEADLDAGRVPSQFRAVADRIITRYNPNRLSENTQRREQFTSYTLNKGDEVSVCLRDGADQSFEPLNELVFVLLHELSHIGTKSEGHTPEFWDNFGWLYQRAIALGNYSYTDYNSRPVRYCGTTISRTPI